ncbi:MAG: hypothetical protein K2Y23_25085 [Cyanobacteria bacterium]|nr:hypothetical protein [Cyanobacteriota bacterium]
MPTPYDDGALVEVRDEVWRVARAQRFESCAILTLDGRDRSNSGTQLRVIDPFDRPRPIARRKLRKCSRRATITSALAAIAGVRKQSGLWTAAAASIELWPYQLEPALAVIRGATRLLLADAVGLGKTIQAGLILSELRERGWVERALIVCPVGLRATWARELRDRFHITPAVLDQTAIAERMASLPPGVSPWSGHGVAIASIDFIKRPEVLSAIEREPLDLVIADEAHHLVPGTDRGAAVLRLAARAPWCVFVSATPHSGDRAAFEYLTALGAAGDPIAIFRRQRRDAGLTESRRTHLLGVRPSDDEAALLAAIENYARAIWLARGRDDPAVRLVATTIARRAASSRAAILRTLERRLALLAGTAVEIAQPLLPWEDFDEADDLEGDAGLGVMGFADRREELDALRQLIALASRCRESSKFRRLERLLDLTGEPAVVFTEYRDTLEAIVLKLARTSRRVLAIHGGLTADARRNAVDQFNAGAARVLVATDAAGEGLNLHHQCRLVIDVELPWNPLRLEQRAGRVDRIGQQRTVHAIRLFHPGTIESAVLEHLRLRRQRADDALDRPVSDADVAAAVFERTPIHFGAAPIRSHSIDARHESQRCACQRRFLHVDAVKSWTSPRRGESRLIAMYRRSWANEDGGLIGEQIEACRVSIGRRRSLDDWRGLIHQLESIDLHWTEAQSPDRDVLARRIESIRIDLERASAVRHQRSLFDRRPDADAADRQAVVDRLDEALVRVLRRITGSRQRTELVALWPERRR